MREGILARTTRRFRIIFDGTDLSRPQAHFKNECVCGQGVAESRHFLINVFKPVEVSFRIQPQKRRCRLPRLLAKYKEPAVSEVSNRSWENRNYASE